MRRILLAGSVWAAIAALGSPGAFARTDDSSWAIRAAEKTCGEAHLYATVHLQSARQPLNRTEKPPVLGSQRQGEAVETQAKANAEVALVLQREATQKEKGASANEQVRPLSVENPEQGLQ